MASKNEARPAKSEDVVNHPNHYAPNGRDSFKFIAKLPYSEFITEYPDEREV